MLETLLAMDPLVIASFMGAGILLNLTPGADVLFAMASGLAGGWRAGVAAAIGITLGAGFHLTLAAFGISAALVALPHAYDVIRYLGAAYLAYLAWRSWTAAPTDATTRGATRLGPAIRRGFLTNAMNPKVALFILAFLPQFTNPDVGPLWHQILILGLIFASTGFVINAAYGALAGVLGGKLNAVGGALNRLSAIVFGGLAARLVFE